MGPLNNEEFIMVTALYGCFWTLNGENDHGNSWTLIQMGIGHNPIPLVDIRIACKWVFIALKKVSIGIDL